MKLKCADERRRVVRSTTAMDFLQGKSARNRFYNVANKVAAPSTTLFKPKKTAKAGPDSGKASLSNQAENSHATTPF